MRSFSFKRTCRGVLFGSLMVSSLGLGGCADMVLGAAAMKFYQAEDVNIVESSYAAADYILQQSNTYYDRYTPILVMPLTDVESMDLSSEFGRTVANQVGSRFGQLGYNVDLSQARLSTAESDPSVRPSDRAPKITIFGTYKRERPEMEINLYMTDIESGSRIAAFRYFIPYDSDIRKLSDPEIRIMRIQ